MILGADSISFSSNKISILRNLNIQVNVGECIAIVGPNGAGKSTFLNLLANEIESGERKKIHVKEKPLPKWTFTELSIHKSKFSQHNSNDIPLLVDDVVLMGCYPYFDSKPTTEDLQIVEKIMHETDISHLQKRDYNTLSGGEKQRVHLARAFVQLENSIEHKMMFLDEPLNNLDVRHQYKTLHLIIDFVKRGNAAIVVPHDLNLAAQFADRIFLMKNGEMVAEGTPDDVFQSERISEVYNFPCTICKNPINNNPLILFGEM